MVGIPMLPFHPSETVLFPGMVHVTEISPTARPTVERCYRTERPLAIVYAHHGRLPSRWPRVGTVGHVTEFEELDYDVVRCAIIGSERIWVEGIRRQANEMMAYVAPYPLDERAPTKLDEMSDDVRRRLLTYLGLLESIQGEPLTRQQVPTAPLSVAFFTAIALQLPAMVKEHLLAIPSLRQLLFTEIEILRREIALLEEMASRQRVHRLPELVKAPLGDISLN